MKVYRRGVIVKKLFELLFYLICENIEFEKTIKITKQMNFKD